MRDYAKYLEHSEKLYEDSTGIKKKVKDKIVDKALQRAQNIKDEPVKRAKSINRTSRIPVKVAVK